jgi:hypothetical protein
MDRVKAGDEDAVKAWNEAVKQQEERVMGALAGWAAVKREQEARDEGEGEEEEGKE